MKWYLTCLALCLLTTEAVAQGGSAGESENEIGFNVTGGVQPRFSYGFEEDGGEENERAGIGLRRGRIDLLVTMGSRMGINYDVDYSNGALGTVDLFGFYNPKDGVRIRLGYFPQAQPRGYIPTSFSRIDGIERDAIAERWARSTLGSSARGFGVDATFSSVATTLTIGIFNGDGSFSSGNYRQSIARFRGEDGRGIEDLAFNMYVNHKLPAGIEVGGFAGYNGARSDNTISSGGELGRRYASWSSHAYWGANPGSQPVRLKLEVIGLHYESNAEADTENRLSVSVTGVVRILQYGELYARYGNADEINDKQFIASGISYSFSARKGQPYRNHRITIGYQGGFQDVGNDQHLFVVQSQIYF